MGNISSALRRISVSLLALAGTSAAGCIPDLHVSSGEGGTTTQGSTGAGGSGGTTPCEPGSATSCYSGILGTEGKGQCNLGAKMCGADGTTYGECMGSGVPSLEKCASSEDENCDGKSGCSGDCLWTRRFVKHGYDGGTIPKNDMGDIAVDSNWNSLVVGGYSGGLTGSAEPIDLGGGILPCKSSRCGFAAKYDALGQHSWSRSFDSYLLNSAHVLENGELIISGQGGGGSGPKLCGFWGGGWNVVVAKLSASGDCTEWGGKILDDKPTGRPHLAIAADGTVYVAVTPSSGNNPLLIGLSKDGKVEWSLPFGGSNVYVTGAAVDASGAVYVTGTTPEGTTVNFGNHQLPGNWQDIYLAKFVPSKVPGEAGNWAWAVSMGAQDKSAFGGDVVVTEGQRVFLVGVANTAMSGSCGSFPAPSGGGALLVAQFNSGGGCMNAIEYPGKIYGEDAEYLRLRADTDSKHLILTGRHHGSFSFGSLLPSYGGLNIFVAKLDDTLVPVWANGYGSAYGVEPYALAVDSGGSLRLAAIGSAVDFGCGPGAMEDGNFSLTRLAP